MHPLRPQDSDFSLGVMLSRIVTQQENATAVLAQLLAGQGRIMDKLDKLPRPKPEVGSIERMVVRALTLILPMLALGGLIKWEDVGKILQAIK